MKISAGLVAGALALAGCGSTVPASRFNSPDVVGRSGGLSAPPSSVGLAPSGTPGTSVLSSGGTALSSGGVVVPSTSAALPDTSLTSLAPSRPASGAAVSIGVLYTAGLQQLANAFGASANTPDPKAYIADLVSYINKHGGLDGRPIAPVYASINTASTTDLAIQFQAACSVFTQDNHVFAVASPSSIDDTFGACITQRQVPLVSAWGIATSSNTTSAAQPLVIVPNAPTYDTAAATLIRALVAEKWATARWPSGNCGASPTPRIGVLINDSPEYRSVYGAVIAPALAAAGTPVTDVEWMTLSGDVAGSITQAATDAQSAILKFKSDCVDHVLIQAPNPVVPELFMVAASTQGYTPRYGWDSDQAPNDAQEISPSLASQLRGSLGVGWQPYNDVPLRQFDATAKAPSERCLAIFTAAGLPPTGRADGYSDLQICDALLFLQTALAGAPQPLTAHVFASQVAELGSGYAPSLTYRSSFTSTQHNGASAFRDFAFSDACTCFRYTSGLQAF
jgi:hypothetical protein